MELLTERKIIPVIVLELKVEDDEVVKRGMADLHSPTRYPKYVRVCTCDDSGLDLFYVKIGHNGPFPSCFEPHYESEAKCKAFHTVISLLTNE